MLAALANGSVVIFRRGSDGQWDLGQHHVLDLGAPHHSIRCMTVVHQSVWCGYRNRIHVVDPRMMVVEVSQHLLLEISKKGLRQFQLQIQIIEIFDICIWLQQS